MPGLPHPLTRHATATQPTGTNTADHAPALPDHRHVHARYTQAGCRGHPCCSSNQVTVRPPRRRHPHRTARPATSESPRPFSVSPPAVGRSSGTPGPLRSVTSTRISPSPVLTATVTICPGSPDPLCRTLLPDSPLTSKTASSPHGGTENLTYERTGDPGPFWPPGNRYAPPDHCPDHEPTTFPARPIPREITRARRATRGCTPGSAAHAKPGHDAQHGLVRGRP